MKCISLDTEYSSKNVRNAELLSISIGFSDSKSEVLHVTPAFNTGYVQSLIDTSDVIFMWNGVVDRFILEKNSIGIPKYKIFDAMLAEHLIDERLDHGLGDWALRNHGDNYKKEFWGVYERYQDAPKEVADAYEHKDAIYTYQAGMEYLRLCKGMMPLVQHVCKLQFAIFDTEIKGIRVNRPLMELTKKTMSTEIAGYINKLKDEHREYCNLWEMQQWRMEIDKRVTDKGKLGVHRPTFSFTSDPQIRWLVYEAMECPVIEKTKKGSPKTDYSTLQILAEDRPELSTIVKYKDIKGVYATFVEGLLERVEVGDRIFPTFFINGTTTGRISHANPNMGNLPTEGVIRNFFIPDEGMRLVGADFSSLEVVVEANLTEDKQLLKIINEGASKHDITAQGLGIDRNDAKRLNFALQYGAGARKVSQLLGVSLNEAENIYTRYWELYSGVKRLKDETVKTLRATGKVTNLFGRTRHFDKPKNKWDAAKQERQAYNHLIQGVGADMTNTASYLVSEYFYKEKLGRFLFSVHDEILCEAAEALTEEAKLAIVTLMESTNDRVKFKYRVSAKPYGPLTAWSKT